MDSLTRIDAHQHFWRFDEAEYGWITPEMAVLRRDHLPGDLEPQLEQAGLHGSVAVQARQTLEEMRWLLQLAERHDFIRGVVGWVDLCDPDVERILEGFAGRAKLAGVRHVLQDEPDRRYMLREDFLRGIGTLARFNLAYDILIYAHQLPEALELVRLFPQQRFVLDHMAKPLIRDGILQPWEQNIRALAAHSNLYCKLSGLVTEANLNRWHTSDFRPYLDVVFDAFGPGRLMLGSDWPVCTLAGSYTRVINIVLDYLAGFDQKDRRAVLGLNAIEFYGLQSE